MSLRDWRKNARKTLEQAAEFLEASSWHCVWRWENRKVVPQPRKVVRIWVLTDGAVDANSYHDFPEISPAGMLARADRLEGEAAGLRALAYQRMGAAA